MELDGMIAHEVNEKSRKGAVKKRNTAHVAFKIYH
jgi:hypothetical protein